MRVIAASNSDLGELVKEGTFRQDLFYRVNVVRLEIPPLRERKEDIPMLAKHFISKINRLHGKSVSGISHDALARLLSHDYPGNIRELENIIEHALVLCPEGQVKPSCLPDYLRSFLPGQNKQVKIDAALQSVESLMIIDALKRNKYNRMKAARDLGIHKSTLFRKIKILGIDLPETDGRAGRKHAL